MRSPAEQHTENLEAAQTRGVHLAEPYRETKAVGASRHSRGTRDDFERLLADLRAGTFGADELWLWEHSRGSRKVGEWVSLIDACEAANVHVWVTTHRRVYDPANARDRRGLLEDALDSEYESAKISERAKRAARATAAAGRGHGKQPYGYRREYDPVSRQLLRVVPDDGTAPIVREIFERFADGASISGIANDLTRRGVATPGQSSAWRHISIRSMLTNEGYLGHRVSGAGHARVDNAWPAIIDEATWRRCKARMAAPHRLPGQRHGVKHLLSGLALCGVPECGAVMVHNPGRSSGRADSPNYMCADRYHNSRNAAGLERQVLGKVFGMWEDEQRVRRAGGVDAQLDELEAAHAGLVDQLREWQESAGDDGVSPTAVRAAERKLAPRIEAAEQRLNVARAAGLLPVVDGPLREQWDGLGLIRQRDIIAASVAITVLPTGKGKRYDPATVEITPRW